MNTAPNSPRGGSLHKWLLFLAAGLLICALPGTAATLRFERVTDNASIDSADDYLVEVLDLGGQALFLISNGSDYEGFINQVYFEDPGSLFDEIDYEVNFSLGEVDYTSPAVPTNPPGLSNRFVTAWSLDAVAPAPTWGIGDGETGAFVGTYNNSSFAELEAAVAAETFRVALHLQGLVDGASDTFLSKPKVDPPIPEPSSLLLLSIGSLVLLRRTRR